LRFDDAAASPASPPRARIVRRQLMRSVDEGDSAFPRPPASADLVAWPAVAAIALGWAGAPRPRRPRGGPRPPRASRGALGHRDLPETDLLLAERGRSFFS
jgi:hypothetical protein